MRDHVRIYVEQFSILNVNVTVGKSFFLTHGAIYPRKPEPLGLPLREVGVSGAIFCCQAPSMYIIILRSQRRGPAKNIWFWAQYV